MEGYRTVLRLLVVVGLFSLSGPGCAWLRAPQPPPLRAQLPPSPTLDQVIQVVNNNSSQIHAFTTDEAVLSVSGTPSLRTNIAFERPRRLRLRAGTGLTGAELDVGSNDSLFWMWVMRQPPLYYCRHDQFAASPARRMLPIEPDWLIEALGITQFDPALVHQGPTLHPGGRLEVQTVRQTADGPATKRTIVDGTTGLVLEQSLYDAQGSLVAQARASRHRRDPMSGLIMPRVVEIDCPRAQFSMRIDLGNVRINPPEGIPAELWGMPTFPDTPMVDLGNPNLQFAPSAPHAARPATLAAAPPAMPPATASLGSRPPRRAWNRVRF